MRSRIFFSFLLTALFVLASSCGTTPNCPICGTTINGAYAVINVIAVPEHNPTGEPGGPFNSFDISTIAPNPAGGRVQLPGLYFRPHRHRHAGDRHRPGSRRVLDSRTRMAISDAGNGASPCPTTCNPATPELHHAECRGDSADRRRIWQLRPVCLQDRFVLGRRSYFPSQHGFWCERQLRRIPRCSVLRLARQWRESDVRT